MTLALIIPLLMVPLVVADTNHPRGKVDKDAGDKCTVPKPWPSTDLGRPVHFSAKDCGASSKPLKYLSSDVAPAHPRAGEMIMVTSHFSVAGNISAEMLEADFQVKLSSWGGMVQRTHAIEYVCGRGPMESFSPWLPEPTRQEAIKITMCGVQCPMTEGSVSISFAVALSSDLLVLPPGLGDISLEFSAKTDNGMLLCVAERFGIQLLNSPVGAAEANQTA